MARLLGGGRGNPSSTPKKALRQIMGRKQGIWRSIVTLPPAPSPNPRDTRTFLKDAARPGARHVALASLCLVADTGAAVGFAAGLAGAVSRLASASGAIAPWLILIVVAGAARGLAGWAATRLAAAGAQQVKSALRRRVLGAVFAAPARRSLAGEAAAAAIDEVEALDGYVVRYLPARAMAGIGPVIVLAFAAGASPVGAALLLATLAPFILLMILAGSAAAQASRDQLDALSKLSGVFADRVRALPLLLAFQTEAQVTDQIARSSRRVADRTLAVLRIAFISTAGLEFFAALSVALVAVYAGFRLLGLLPFALPDTLSFEHAFFVLALAPEFYAPMRRLAAAYHERQLGEAAADRLQALLARPRVAEATAPMLSGAPTLRFEQAVVGFADDPELRIGPVDFEATAGSIMALTGATGAGKTSLLRLLVGESELVRGSVIVGGRALADLGPLTASIGWAGQTPTVLPGSLGWNIGLAAPEAGPEAVRRAALDAGLAEAIDHRGGLDAILDERGGGLSGGERRRIGLARAFLKDAPILLLDEPTADLDEAAEAAMIAAIRRAARGRTVLIATHSAALIAIADQVVML
jgi:ATP-binding cassette subfamily C protein CydD